MTRAIRNVLHGPLPDQWMAVAESTWPLRKLPYLILLASLLVFGFYPRLLVDKIKPAVARVVPAAALAVTAPSGGPLAAVEAEPNDR